MTTGQRIQQARKKAGLSQKQLGEKLGLSASMIGQWENDLRKPKYETIQRILDALGISFPELMGMKPIDDDTWITSDKEHIEEIENFLHSYEGSINAENEKYIRMDRERVEKAFNKLNRVGQQEAVKRVEELTEIPRYCRQEPAEAPLSSPGDTDTPTPQDAPEGAEEGE